MLVIAVAAAASALSTEIDAADRVVLLVWLPVMLLTVVANAASTLIEAVERLTEL